MALSCSNENRFRSLISNQEAVSTHTNPARTAALSPNDDERRLQRKRHLKDPTTGRWEKKQRVRGDPTNFKPIGVLDLIGKTRTWLQRACLERGLDIRERKRLTRPELVERLANFHFPGSKDMKETLLVVRLLDLRKEVLISFCNCLGITSARIAHSAPDLVKNLCAQAERRNDLTQLLSTYLCPDGASMSRSSSDSASRSISPVPPPVPLGQVSDEQAADSVTPWQHRVLTCGTQAPDTCLCGCGWEKLTDVHGLIYFGHRDTQRSAWTLEEAHGHRAGPSRG